MITPPLYYTTEILYHCALYTYIYILSVFTEKPSSKQLKCNVHVVYIPITTVSQAVSVTSSSLQSDRTMVLLGN